MEQQPTASIVIHDDSSSSTIDLNEVYVVEPETEQEPEPAVQQQQLRPSVSASVACLPGSKSFRKQSVLPVAGSSSSSSRQQQQPPYKKQRKLALPPPVTEDALSALYASKLASSRSQAGVNLRSVTTDRLGQRVCTTVPMQATTGVLATVKLFDVATYLATRESDRWKKTQSEATFWCASQNTEDIRHLSDMVRRVAAQLLQQPGSSTFVCNKNH